AQTLAQVLDPKEIAAAENSRVISVTGSPGELDRVAELIKAADRAVPQVRIEARLVETTIGDRDALGIDWQLVGGVRGASRPTTFPFDSRHQGGVLFPNNNTEGSQITQDTPTTTTTTTNGSAFDPGDSFPLAQRPDFVFGSLDFTQFQAMLEILQAKGNAKLVASPQITALDGVEARIHIGETIPVPTYSRNEQYNVTYVTGYQDRDVGTTMLVTPHVNDDRTVTLDVRPEVSVITGYVGQFHEVPIVAKRRAETQVRLVYGRTLVIGGLVRDKEITRESKVPLLGDIPLLGYLFRYQSTETEKTDLLIFVTPTIVDQDQEEQQSSGKQEFHGAWIPTEDAQRYERILATACHRDALQRMQAARDLGLLRTDAERALIQPADVLARMLLADPDEQVRIAAGRALMRCDPRAFVGAITEIRERRDTGQIQTLLLLALNEEVI
ncbi:MAG: type II and III secretion system protein, partial [Planctomycetota bacterium]